MGKLFAILLITGLLAAFVRPKPPGKAYVSERFPEELPGPFTGGFSEETCRSCHFDYPLNPDLGSLTVEGIPDQYQAEKSYQIKISVMRKDLGKAGFQFSSRFEDGDQAGLLKVNSNRLSFTETESNVQYLQHSADGANVQNSDSTHWNFTWIAPNSNSDTVFFNIAANAGNGDASAFGDYIYLREISSKNTQQPK